MESDNQLLWQFEGFLKTPPLFIKSNELPLFHFSENEVASSSFSNLPPIPKNLVLGKRVELFFRACLEASEKYQVVAANLQVIQDKVTIGELDFLLKDKQKHLFYHVELVYKFYLYDPAMEKELARWVGPNKRDALLYKIRKLKKQQLPLLHKKATEPELKRLQIQAAEFLQQVCFLGKLFVPYQYKDKLFPGVNNRCITGYWLDFKTFKDSHKSGEYYCIPQKENWLIDPKHNEQWIPYEDLLKQLNVVLLNKQSPLCWKKTSHNTYEQFFVVWWK